MDSCPVCGAPTESGYGFAFGGGLGTYTFCTDETCDWYVKAADPEAEPPDEPA